jgi:hypothetical protein
MALTDLCSRSSDPPAHATASPLRPNAQDDVFGPQGAGLELQQSQQSSGPAPRADRITEGANKNNAQGLFLPNAAVFVAK